jgi:hypothetical protein
VTVRVAQSFNDDEVTMLNELMHKILRNAHIDTSVVKHPAFANLMRKANSMKTRIVKLREEKTSVQ